MTWLVVSVLRLYRALVSPLYGPVCKYHPSCSAYALEAVSRFGAVKGLWLAGRRLVRCNPWSLGGYDPVPGHVEPGDVPDAGSGASRRFRRQPDRRDAPVRDHGDRAPGSPPLPPPDANASTPVRTSSEPALTREARQ